MPILKYIEMTGKEISELPKDNSICLSAISPLENHGPHLPVGTDIFIAETLRDRITNILIEKDPERNCVILPTLPLGSDPIPSAGSLELRYSAIEGALTDWGKSLHKLGFKTWILTDNHGGPHHQMAISMASQKLAKRGFHLIAPFNYVFREMVALSPEMRAATGLDAGNCGDVSDMHAGTNETSLMRAAHPDKTRDLWQKIGPGKKSPNKPLSSALIAASKFFDSVGMKEASADFFFLGNGLSWVSDPSMDSWQGDPSASDPAAGEAMLNYHAATAVKLAEQALSGKQPRIHPLGWSIRMLRRFI